MKKVYVSGPYSGNVTFNIRLAIEAADTLLLNGFAPFIPHLNYSWDLVHPHSYSTWLDWCLEWIPVCDCLLRIYGESPGADREVELARFMGIPVYESMHELLERES